MIGQIVLTGGLVAIVIFNLFNFSFGTIMSMICVVIAFQASIGPILFIHAFETCHPAIVGFANFGAFFWAVTSAFIGPIIMGKFGITWLFTLFGSISLLGVFYSTIFVKDTTYTEAL